MNTSYQNYAQHTAKMARAWAADVRAYDPQAVDPKVLDRKLQQLCGGITPTYMTARRFVFEGDPDFETICQRYQIRIDIIKHENKIRGHRRARQIAQERALIAKRDWVALAEMELPY